MTGVLSHEVCAIRDAHRASPIRRNQLNQNKQEEQLVTLGRAAAGLTIETMTPEVLQRSKQRVLDTLGCLVAGYDAGIAEGIRSYALSQGGSPEATLLPGGQKTTVALAGLAHSTYIHGLELSDAAPRGTVHPGNEIVPAALALAERGKLGGRALLPAVVAGYEIEIRFGRSLFPSAFYRGWWTPGIFAGIGPAVTAAHMMGLDGKGIDNTIGIVLNMLPTAMIRANEEGESVKWLIGGQACAAGLLAAEMAARGTTGMRDIVAGWLPVISEKFVVERLTEGINADGSFSQWEILSGILTKFYATVGPLTASLDATFVLIEKHDIRMADIVEIVADVPTRTAVFNTVHPENEIAARASLPFCVAVAVKTRDPSQLLGPAFRAETLKDPEVRALASKVRITVNEDYESQYPARSLAHITFKMKDGSQFSMEDDRNAHSRYLKPSDADIEDKFRRISTQVLGKTKTDRVISLVDKLDKLPDVRELVDSLRVER
jgi:2-methylcitrate dehydratase PrpD